MSNDCGGGWRYDEDIRENRYATHSRPRRNTSSSGFSFSEQAQQVMGGCEENTKLLPIQNGKVKIADCFHKNSGIVIFDQTASMGDAAIVVSEDIAEGFLETEKHGYCEDMAILIGAVGDCHSDKRPVQISQFSQSKHEIMDYLEAILIEKNGGAQGKESYADMAWYLLYYCDVSKSEHAHLFLIGDECFYEKIRLDHLKAHFKETENSVKEKGHEIKQETDESGKKFKYVSSREVWQKLKEKMEIFFMYPKVPREKRIANIDQEIAKRLAQAGGKDGDVRFSLMWNNRNDLDLHCICPCGTEIYYANKCCTDCGGRLDVDMNVRGETTKPVENIYWPTGKTPIGNFEVFVQNYAYHESKRDPIACKVEVKINDQIEHFDLIVSPNSETGSHSNITVKEFNYAGPKPKDDSIYEKYEDTTVLRQWEEILGGQNILILEDPNIIVTVYTGVVALKNKTRDLETFIEDVKARTNPPSPEAIEAIRKALLPYAESLSLVCTTKITGRLPVKTTDPAGVTISRRKPTDATVVVSVKSRRKK